MARRPVRRRPVCSYAGLNAGLILFGSTTCIYGRTDPTEPRAEETRPLSPIFLPWPVRRRKRGRKRGRRNEEEEKGSDERSVILLLKRVSVPQMRI